MSATEYVGERKSTVGEEGLTPEKSFEFAENKPCFGHSRSDHSLIRFPAKESGGDDSLECDDIVHALHHVPITNVKKLIHARQRLGRGRG